MGSMFQDLFDHSGEDQSQLAAPQRTPEFERILALPRRADDFKYPDLTVLFRVYGGGRGASNFSVLRPIQNAMLCEAAEANGLFAPVGVGHGKTLVSLLLPETMRALRPLLVLPSAMIPQLACDRNQWATEFRVPALLKVHDDEFAHWAQDGVQGHWPLQIISYECLSRLDYKTFLRDGRFDLVVCDEAHHLCEYNSARTRRIRDYGKAAPECAFVFMSGTFTNRTIMQYAHLIELALRGRSPLPSRRFYHELLAWAETLDSGKDGAPGALRALQANAEEPVRSAYRRRLTSTMGVVATGESALGTSLRIRKWDGAPIFQTGVLPTSIDEAYDRVSKNWELDGTEFHQATQVHAALRQLMCGFYYKWEWPNGRDEAWIHASKIWSQVSNHLMRQGTVDSDADAQRYVQQNGPASDQRILAAWLDARKRPGPTTVPVWLSPHLINAVREWTNERMYRNERGVVWYEFDAIGEQMRVLGWPVFGGGTKDALSLLSTTDPVIVCSRQAHGTGKNLQDRYWWNLVLTVMPNGKLWEQMLGRTHRPGQPHDTVFCDVNVPDDIARKAWQSAREDACYIEQTTGMPQKILYGANSVLM